MATKQIVLKVIPAKIANAFVRATHYSGKVVNNSQLHFGVFHEGVLHGVLSFGCPLDKRRVLGLVKGTKWNEMLELNRMALDDTLGKNAESRSIAVALRLIRKNAPHIKFVLSFADGTQCGDGTIYRASGFKLTGISKGSMIELPPKYWGINGGKYAHRMTLQAKSNRMYSIIQRDLGLSGQYKQMEWYAEKLGTRVLEGYQFRYIYLLDKTAELTVPVIPFSKIREIGGGMYKGQRRDSSPTLSPTVEGGQKAPKMAEGEGENGGGVGISH